MAVVRAAASFHSDDPLGFQRLGVGQELGALVV